MQEPLIQRLDTLISALARPRIPPERELWDADQCAAYMGNSARHFAERIACRPDFPRGVRLGDGSKAPLRWYAMEVMEWVAGRREKRAA